MVLGLLYSIIVNCWLIGTPGVSRPGIIVIVTALADRYSWCILASVLIVKCNSEYIYDCVILHVTVTDEEE